SFQANGGNVNMNGDFSNLGTLSANAGSLTVTSTVLDNTAGALMNSTNGGSLTLTGAGSVFNNEDSMAAAAGYARQVNTDLFVTNFGGGLTENGNVALGIDTGSNFGNYQVNTGGTLGITAGDFSNLGFLSANGGALNLNVGVALNNEFGAAIEV